MRTHTHTHIHTHEVVAGSRFWVGLSHGVEVWRLADILKIVFRTKCQMIGALYHARANCAADANEADSSRAVWGWMTTALLKELNISTYICHTSYFAHALLCQAYIWGVDNWHLCRPMRSWQPGMIFKKEPLMMERHSISQLWANGAATLLGWLIKAAVLYSHWNEGIFKTQAAVLFRLKIKA